MATPEEIASAQAVIDAQKHQTSFTPEYVAELRRENANLRTKADETLRNENESLARKLAAAITASEEATKSATDHAASAKATSDAAAAKLLEETAKHDQRVIRAELKAEAIKAGVVDIDVLKLADLSKLALDDKGDVVGGAELIKALKESKPWAFGTVASTTTTEKSPKTGDPKPFNAITSTAEERAAEAKKRGLVLKIR